ncbi:MAG: hypothetical protein AMS25_00080 [Gemmatimonas sp. SM23_52]|nr:MAG: hypothetical protein AMS25_00080 [Gemmatimonas sp. SM23_52]
MDRLWIQDEFACLGVRDGFLNADETSCRMPTLLAEPRRALRSHYDDDEMISYAEQARANRATQPWAMQLTPLRRGVGRHAYCTSASSSAGPTGMRR